MDSTADVIYSAQSGEKCTCDQSCVPEPEKELIGKGRLYEDQESEHDLKESADLPERGGFELPDVASEPEQERSDENDEIAAYHQNDEPRWKQADNSQYQEKRDEQGLICQGIQNDAYFSTHLQTPRCETVEPICQPCQKNNA